MGTETIESSASTGAVAQGDQTARPEQNSGVVAQPQGDAKDAGASQPEGSEDGDKPLTDEQRAVRKLQRRVDRLTAKRGGLERENELLRQQLERLGHLQQSPAGQSQDDGASEGQGEPRPKGRQLTEADVERLAIERAKELHRQQTISERVGRVLASGSKLDGFDAAVNAVAEVVPFTDRQGRPTAFIEAVLDADDPAAVLKYLGDNPDEADDFADLTPAQLGRRLAKLEDKLKPGAKKETSAAPKPLKPVSGNNAGSEPDPSKMTDAEFIAWRKKQIQARGVFR